MINISRFDLTTLRIFLIAAREGSLTVAAEHVTLTLSAASKRLADLERAIDCLLFIRHARGLTLTPAGVALYHHAEQIINGIERMASVMEDYSHGVRGHIRIWANPSSVIQFLPQSLTGFGAKHPDIKIGLEERLSGEIVNALLTQQADLGVFADDLPTEGLQTFVYRSDRLVLLVREDHPLAQESEITFKQALPYDFIGLNKGSSLLTRLSNMASKQQQALRLRIQVSSFDAICHMVAAGMGISIIPANVSRPSAFGVPLRILPLIDKWTTRHLLVGVPKGAMLRPEVQNLYDHLQAEVALGRS